MTMYLAVDIGGSKTLMAAFSNEGKIIKEFKFATNNDYSKFLKDLEANFKKHFSEFEFVYACCAAPGSIDRRNGTAKDFGNLKWHNTPIKTDASRIFGCPVLVENDANLAGLSEALLTHKKYKVVLYVTISTGIGSGIIIDDVIDPYLADSEAGHMMLQYEGKVQEWEAFASGRALKEKYNQLASQIEDPAIWKDYAKLVAIGLFELFAIVQPDILIVGGGVGAHLEKFDKYLKEELHKIDNPLVEIPPIMKAQRPEEAVIYGCYDFIKQNIYHLAGRK